MKISWLVITKSRAQKRLYPKLKGRVFHITSVDNFIKIMKTGAIKHNRDGLIKSNHPYSSYFKNRGFVSFCDFHGNVFARKTREAALTKYDIFSQGDGERFVFLFLKPEYYSKLVSWTNWKTDNACNEMIVPHLEAGFPDFVPIEGIEEATLIHIPKCQKEHEIDTLLLHAMQNAIAQ
jgi:hypothetical protein